MAKLKEPIGPKRLREIAHITRLTSLYAHKEKVATQLEDLADHMENNGKARKT